MDYTDSVKYYFFRLLLLLGTNALGLFMGKALLWVIASVLPYSLETVKNFLIDDRTGSVIAAVTMIIALGLVFHDDAKAHAAYENMDMVPVLTSIILLLAVYFVPVIFYNQNDITTAVETAYYIFYYPCRWLIEFFGLDLMTSAALGMVIVLGVQFFIYQITYINYKRKHPFIFKPDPEKVVIDS